MSQLPRVIQLKEFSSGEFFELDPLKNGSPRGPGTYRQLGELQGNSILSSVFIEAIDPGATLKINYYDTTTGSAVGERFELTGHDLITDAVTPLTTLRILVTKIHHRITAEAIVTGGNVKFSLYVTLVSSSASDLDVSLKEQGSLAVLAQDKGLPVMGYDSTDGKFYFLPLENDAVKVVFSNLSTVAISKETLGAANTEHEVTSPLGTKRILLRARAPAKILLSYTAGDIALGKYLTVEKGAVYQSETFEPSARKIYLQSSVAGLEVEVETWA